MPDYTDSRLVSLLAGEGRVACSVSLARGTEEGMDPDDLLCSRNARPQKALVGRAQWETNSGHPPGGVTSELRGII